MLSRFTRIGGKTSVYPFAVLVSSMKFIKARSSLAPAPFISKLCTGYLCRPLKIDNAERLGNIPVVERLKIKPSPARPTA